MSTKVTDYDYHLPEDLIGETPSEPRDHSRLLVIDKNTRKVEDKIFYNIIDYLEKGDILVRNSTKVIPARLFGKKESGGVVEILLVKRIDLVTWECLIKPGKRVAIGQRIIIGENRELVGELIEIKPDGNRIVKFQFSGSFEENLDKLGGMPLPPYIRKELKEKDRYQTVYAIRGESIAAPTAGLHFTKELLEKIESKGIEILDIFLEVGIGTFRPVQDEDILNHKMHSEWIEIPKNVAEKINDAKKKKRRIIGVGTTTVRALESSVDENGQLQGTKKETNIFIYPGYEFKIIDALITNFHLPKSTLLMLVSAFTHREFMLEVYKEAVKKEYQFFSFGDAMFIK